jgi:hypothetical protein
VFVCDTGEFMLSARVIDALTTVWPGWREAALEDRPVADP